jgi:hypothetical protein
MENNESKQYDQGNTKPPMASEPSLAYSTNNMRWLGEPLIEHAQSLSEEPKPYTMDEVNEMLDLAECNFEAGLGIPDEDVFRELEEELGKDTRREPTAQAKKVM